MATAMKLDQMSVDYKGLCLYNQDKKVSAKSVSMCSTALWKNLICYRELLLMLIKWVG